MTDAELDAIEGRVDAIRHAHQIDVGQCVAASARDVPVLVAEVKRLRDGLRFLREELFGNW